MAYHDREAYFEEVHEGELVSVLLSHASAHHVGTRAYQGTVTSQTSSVAKCPDQRLHRKIEVRVRPERGHHSDHHGRQRDVVYEGRRQT